MYRIKKMPQAKSRYCPFYTVFFKDCKIFFEHATLCALALPSERAVRADWFRNHRPVKQIYRIIVKKKREREREEKHQEQQDRFVETTNNALQAFDSDSAQFRNQSTNHIAPLGQDCRDVEKSAFAARGFNDIDRCEK